MSDAPPAAEAEARIRAVLDGEFGEDSALVGIIYLRDRGNAWEYLAVCIEGRGGHESRRLVERPVGLTPESNPINDKLFDLDDTPGHGFGRPFAAFDQTHLAQRLAAVYAQVDACFRTVEDATSITVQVRDATGEGVYDA